MMRFEQPNISILGTTLELILRDGSGGKASPGGDGQMCVDMNCSLDEIDD